MKWHKDGAEVAAAGYIIMALIILVLVEVVLTDSRSLHAFVPPHMDQESYIDVR